MTLVFSHDYIRILFIIDVIWGSIGLVWLYFIYKNSHKKKDDANKENPYIRTNNAIKVRNIREISNKIHHIQDVKNSEKKTENGQTHPKNLSSSSHAPTLPQEKDGVNQNGTLPF